MDGEEVCSNNGLNGDRRGKGVPKTIEGDTQRSKDTI